MLEQYLPPFVVLSSWLAVWGYMFASVWRSLVLSDSRRTTHFNSFAAAVSSAPLPGDVALLTAVTV